MINYIVISFLYPLMIQFLNLGSGTGDFMRQTGKIHVVYGVILIIFIGIVVFLIFLERKISQIEKRIKND